MSANDSSDATVTSNPYRFNNIGVQKLLEINSEENHDDVCLAYVFTYRDFADGVLGLAWMGESGTIVSCTVNVKKIRCAKNGESSRSRENVKYLGQASIDTGHKLKR